jgi:hypothetical protein
VVIALREIVLQVLTDHPLLSLPLISPRRCKPWQFIVDPGLHPDTCCRERVISPPHEREVFVGATANLLVPPITLLILHQDKLRPDVLGYHRLPGLLSSLSVCGLPVPLANPLANVTPRDYCDHLSPLINPPEDKDGPRGATRRSRVFVVRRDGASPASVPE